MQLSSDPKIAQQTAHFEYKTLSLQQRTIVQNCTGEIKKRLRRTAQDIWEIGKQLDDVRSQLKHGQFETWLKAEFGWSRRTAYNFINVYEAFNESTNFAQLDIATSALYKLAAPSTSKSLRNGFLAKAQKGQKITHKIINQALTATKSPSTAEKPQPILLPSQQILQVIPKARTGLEELEVQKTAIEERPWRDSLAQGPSQAFEVASKDADLGTHEFDQTEISSKSNMTLTQSKIKSGCWYLFERINVLFCGDTALAEFYHRAPEATLAIAITADDWDHDWLIEKVSNLIVLQESYLRPGLIEQTISLFSAEGDSIIFPWLPDEDMLAIAHRLNRRIVAGDPSPEKCQNAIAKVGLTFEQLTLSKDMVALKFDKSTILDDRRIRDG